MISFFLLSVLYMYMHTDTHTHTLVLYLLLTLLLCCYPQGPLLSVAGDESVPKVTVLDLAHSNMTTARELSPLIHMVAGQRQENHRDTDVKSKANPVEVSRTIELTAGERLAQGVCNLPPPLPTLLSPLPSSLPRPSFHLFIPPCSSLLPRLYSSLPSSPS